MNTQAFIVGGTRSAFAKYGGPLSGFRLDDLLGQVMKAACDRLNVPLDQVDDITAGCVNVAHEGMGDLGRWAALAAGFPDSVPAITVNRFCASSLSGAINLAHAARVDELDIGVAGGVESMSRSGWAIMKGEAPFSPRGPQFILDTMWSGAGGPPYPGLLARDAYISMIETAQNVADKFQLTREQIDAFALRSHHHAAIAAENGRLAKEIHPITIPGKRGAPDVVFDRDEAIRPGTSLDSLAKLAPQPNTTQMTAGNSTPLTDGASAVIVASERGVHRLGVDPLARVVASATHALDPGLMGIAPAWAIQKALDRAGIKPADVDVWEIHEAFSAQALGVMRQLDELFGGFAIPDEKLNPSGGSVAVGHPFGASGARYILTLATELKERGVRYGVLGVCAGSGQGVALVLENHDARP